MRRNVELYIQGQKADLFDFEDINITNSIKDIKDIGRVFTDYTQDFTIPASKANNKILRHYYNFDLLDSFDARIKVDATIKVSGSDYREGKLTLMGSTLKKGMPYSYKVVFYGKSVSLKDIIKDDQLDDLGGTLLDDFSFTYSPSFVEESLKNGKDYDGSELVTPSVLGNFDFCFPFISSESYYFYDSANGTSPKDRVDSRNIWNHTGHVQAKKGIYYKDLKPAIRLYWIVKAIEQKYNIQFSNDFFTSTNATFYDLFMLLHRESGSIGNQLDITQKKIKLGDFDYATGEDLRGLFASVGQPHYTSDYLNMTNNQLSVYRQAFNITNSYFKISFTVTPSAGATGNYNLSVKDVFNPQENTNGWLYQNFELETLFEEQNIDGGQATDFEFEVKPDPESYNQNIIKIIEPEITISTLAGIASFTITNVVFEYRLINVGTNDDTLVSSSNYTYESGSPVNLGGGVTLNLQMPKMKVMDLLTSLFKTFNLTAYFVPDNAQNEFSGQIRVRTVDSFFQSGKEIDITQYVDTDKTEVNRNNLYSEINFEFEKASTFAIIKSNEITKDEFGNETFDSTGDSLLAFDGGKYDIKPKFEKMMYERMSDQDNELYITDACWGWIVNESENPITTKPLIFYPIRKSISFEDASEDTVTSFVFDSSIYDEDGEMVTPSHSSISTYIRPSNSVIGMGQSINFGSEEDEFHVWDGNGSNEQSLYSTFYSKYVSSIYDVQGRTLKLKANLPVPVILKLEPNDTLIINNRKFKINKIKLNINTGSSDLELINDTVYTAALPDASFLRVYSTSTTSTQIQISDENAGNRTTSYKIYVDNSLHATSDNNAPIISGLLPNTTYSIKVISVYINGLESEFSNELSITTVADTPLALAENGDTLIAENNDNIILE